MTSFIPENQPLFALSFLISLIIILLLVLQCVIVRYDQWLFTQVIRYWVRAKQYLGQNKCNIQLKGKYPKLYVIISQRFDLRDFSGLSLTLLCVVIGCILALFIGLVQAVVTLNSIVALDYGISAQMRLLRDSNIINFFIQITSFASTPIAVLVILFTAVNCWSIRQRYVLIGLLIATLSSTAFTFLSKPLFHRKRPADMALLEQTYSFPSGHATTAIALYGFVAYLLIQFNPNFVQKTRIFVITIFFIILIGLSRIVLNQHYLSDVLGGYLVGAFWLAIGISVTEWLSAKNKIIWQVDWSPSHVSMIWLSGVGIFISSLIYTEFYQFPLLF